MPKTRTSSQIQEVYEVLRDYKVLFHICVCLAASNLKHYMRIDLQIYFKSQRTLKLVVLGKEQETSKIYL